MVDEADGGEDESEIEDKEDNTDVSYGSGVDSEYEDSPVQCLIRIEPRIDFFDVEALEVHGVHRRRIIIQAFQILGVVFGDVGTSPLYTFIVMFSKAPINGDEDVIGELSLVVLLHLYSLISRHAKVSLLPNLVPSDTRISGFMLNVPSPELERSLKIKERLETPLTLYKLLLMLVLAGTSMVIADGVVTPAMSVMSSVGGLKVGVGEIEQNEVVMISVAFLVILFSVQKFGTIQVGLVVGHALFIWFCSLAGIGIYNLVKHDTSVLRAFNSVHIYLYFKRNSVMRLEAVLYVQQDAMRNILIVFAKLNLGIRYVQGMNEILAPLFYVFKNDPDAEMAQLDNSNVGIRSTISRLSQLLKEYDEKLWHHLEITNKEHYGKGERSTPLLRHHASLPRERVPAPKDENDQVDGENNTASMTKYGSKSASASMTQYGSEIQVVKALEAWIWYMATV
ncbi:Potassium transporter 13 [Hibiscus syriacus]|uniref:Potassium transporter 13 n=1 Tax=Hibiscus syriacus TaxID=106335 RepID=A0A6A3BPT3_HIBSY|nr:Potassium transporter 13 [Hibiscus syriacus]